MNLTSLFTAVIMFLMGGGIIAQYLNVESQERDVVLNYSVTHVLYSENVQDSFYIYVKLPKYYSKEKDNYNTFNN